MKLFFCLFAVYILVLAGIPCQADDGCCADNHHSCSAPCSPFFACGACHGFVVPCFDLPLPARRAAVALRPAIYKSRPLPDFHAVIWQPPKSAIA